jgi:hypothetical protein
MYESPSLRRNLVLSPANDSTTFEWNLALGDLSKPLPELDGGTGLKIVVWSQSVASDNWTGGLLTNQGGVLGIYIVVMFVIGLGIRGYVIGSRDLLWLNKMERPQKLYRMVVAINAFRSAGYVDHEAAITDQFINALRSRETCLLITASESM